MNLYDAGVVSKILKGAGYRETSEEEAELLLFLTCSVREHAERRALGRILSLKGSNKTIVVGGCMAQRLKDKLLEYGADIVVGPSNYRNLPGVLKTYEYNKTPQIVVEESLEDYSGIIPCSNGNLSGFIAIMRGCNNFCSYCIVPFLRGRERSKPIRDILEEAERFKEVTLIGQNVLAYNYQGIGFAELLEMVSKLKNIKRIRFLTSHPKDLKPEILYKIASLPKVCPYFHLPLQSGSNRILKLMNRGYTREDYLALIQRIRSLFKNVSITTDIIVGFPTETEEDFKATLDMVENVRFDFAYMFRYSPREGTRAIEFEPQVEPSIAKSRLSTLIKLQNSITKEKNLELVGRVVEVMVEGRNRRGEFYGRTPTNKLVIIKDKAEIGEITRVRITEIKGWTLISKRRYNGCP